MPIERRLPWFAPLASFSLLAVLGCVAARDQAPSEDDREPPDLVHQHWDSQGGNPTHATHSYLTEVAVDAIEGWFPEVGAYRASILDGVNRELHELPLADAEQEALRVEDGGNNWGCDRPDVVLAHARERYAAGDKAKAYWFVGIFLHYVEDAGVPAHALHVYHQASPSDWDHFEVMALQKWWPRYSTLDRDDPWLSDAAEYVEWTAEWTRDDFAAAFPGVTYTRTLYPMSWLWASSRYRSFMRDRQGRTAMAAAWALRSIVTQW